MRQIITQIGTFLFPKTCILCNQLLIEPNEDSQNCLKICKSCLGKVPLRLFKDRFIHLDENFWVHVAFYYSGFIPKALNEFKFADAVFLTDFFAVFLVMCLKSLLKWDKKIYFDAVVPVPLSSRRLQERGYNQAELLAQKISQALDIPCVPDCIYRCKDTMQQSSFIDPEDRRMNINQAFAVSQDWNIEGWNILLVDDVITTGYTLIEAANVLYKNGANWVMATAVASNKHPS